MSARKPYLDGLRALSIVPVLLSHSFHQQAHVSFWRVPLLDGALGVTVFFVVSGYLITGLLSDEKRRDGSVRLKAFYGRRLAKLLPALWLFLALTGPWALATERATGWDLAYAATLTTGFFPFNWVFGHVWSLTVEEVFYVSWAPVMTFFSRRAASRFAVAAFGFSILATLLSRLAASPSYSDLFGWWPRGQVPEYLGCVAAGSLASLHERKLLDLTRRFHRVSLLWSFLPALAVVTLFRLNYPALELQWPTRLLTMPSVVAISLAVVFLLGVAQGQFEAGRKNWLAWAPLTALGRATYSIYVFQQFFSPDSRDPHPPWFQASPLNLLLAVGCGLAIHRFVEEPARVWLVARFGWSRAREASAAPRQVA